MEMDVIEFPSITQSCGDCEWSDCCVNRALNRAESQKSHANRTIAYRKNNHLFRQGDGLDSLYFLRSGSAKSIVCTTEGIERIVGFHFAGDIVGFDGIMSKRHQSTTVALETAGVCRIPFARLKNESIGNADFWDEVLSSIGAAVAEKQNYALLLGQKSVHARFAAFLCQLSSKYASRGCSGEEFNLSMSRQDIANYLSMAVETLSRLISEFQQRGLIKVERRFVRIIDVPSLRTISHSDSHHASACG